MLIVIAIIVFVIIVAARSTAAEFKGRDRRKLINNAIADLIEDGSITVLTGKGEDGENQHYVVRGAKSPQNPIAQQILVYGLGASNKVTAKDFHAGLYENKDKIHEFITKTEVAIPKNQPSPKDRMESGHEGLAVLLPLLILGDIQGYSTSDSSSVYLGDSDYAGHSDNGGDGGDGGDGGGGDGGGGD